MRDTQSMRFLRTNGQLIFVVVLGYIFRSIAPNWDHGARIHPDEGLIVNGALSVKFFSQLFPGFHDYNGFSIYLLALWGKFFTAITSNTYWSQTPEGLTIAGRHLAAVLSTLAIFPVYTIGKLLWSKETGLIAAWLLSFTPLLIQLAHFYTTENILLLLITVLLYQAVMVYRQQRVGAVFPMAFVMGLLMATKNTAYLMLPLPFLALLRTEITRYPSVHRVALFGGIAGITFFIFSPYTFLDLAGYLTRSRYLADVVSGRLPMDWTIQFAETNALFWLRTLPLALGIPFFMGTAGMLRVLYRKHEHPLLPILALWSLGFTVFISATYLKFTRYSLPVIPLLCIFAAYLLSAGKNTPVSKGITTLFLIAQLLLGSMYASIFFSPHSSVRATSWIQANIPRQSSILIEDWNSIIRFTSASFIPLAYEVTSFNFYAPDTQQKTLALASLLEKADYLILESPKVKNTILRLSDRYPATARFYRDLENGRLAFRIVAEFSSYPRFGTIVIFDEQTEETFTVFDHPTIRIYRRIDSTR